MSKPGYSFVCPECNGNKFSTSNMHEDRLSKWIGHCRCGFEWTRDKDAEYWTLPDGFHFAEECERLEKENAKLKATIARWVELSKKIRLHNRAKVKEFGKADNFKREFECEFE